MTDPGVHDQTIWVFTITGMRRENGLLLSPNIDHLFDKGFLSFSGSGAIVLSPLVAAEIVRRLGVNPDQNVGSFSDG
jgi:hypothetical protein